MKLKLTKISLYFAISISLTVLSFPVRSTVVTATRFNLFEEFVTDVETRSISTDRSLWFKYRIIFRITKKVIM